MRLMFSVLLVILCCQGFEKTGSAQKNKYTIAFSSCLSQDLDTSIWNIIGEKKPDLFLFTGDTVYADTINMNAKRRIFAKLNSDPFYSNFKKGTRVLAVWDDHDYGFNDVGGSYAQKREMQKIFLDAFDEPTNSMRRKQQGIYTVEEMNLGGKIIQTIVLDVRYFRSNWTNGPRIFPYARTYIEDNRETSTFLGKTQWAWLRAQIAKKADLRILVSSTPILSDDYLGERWGAFPKERARLFHEMAAAQSGKWIIVTGDRHFAQILKRVDVLPYLLIELTASGMNFIWLDGSRESDRYREGTTLADANFGMLHINGRSGVVRYSLHSSEGAEWKQGEMDF